MKPYFTLLSFLCYYKLDKKKENANMLSKNGIEVPYRDMKTDVFLFEHVWSVSFNRKP